MSDWVNPNPAIQANAVVPWAYSFDPVSLQQKAVFKGSTSLTTQTIYNGGRVDPTIGALNINQILMGTTSGQDWIGANNITITDNLSVNPSTNTICSFQGQIIGSTLFQLTTPTGTPVLVAPASISGSVVTFTTNPPAGTITAGLTLTWAGGTATIISGGGPSFNLEASHGTVTLQTMTVIGPKPAQILQWASDDPDNPNQITVSGYAGTPGQFNLPSAPGDAAPQPMSIVKLSGPPQQAIMLNYNHNYGGAGITGGRTGPRFQMTQIGPMPGHANYQNLLASHAVRYSSGGTDLWSGSAGNVWGAAIYFNFTKVVGQPGPTNYRAAVTLEMDYGGAAGLSGTDVSVASIGALLASRWATHQAVPPMWEADFCYCVGQAASSVSDGAGGFLPEQPARYAFRIGSLNGVRAVHPTQGRALAAIVSLKAYNTDGSDGPNVIQFPWGVDWMFSNITGAIMRWQGQTGGSSGGAILGSASARPGGIQVGGGILSATSTTVSLDVAGSICTGFSSIADGGLNLRPSLACSNDQLGLIFVVTDIDASGRATDGMLRTTGNVVTSQIPVGAVLFRPIGAPISFPGAGPTGPQLNLTWQAPTTLALGASGTIALPALGGGDGTVSVGAADSGGAGFRVLRVPN